MYILNSTRAIMMQMNVPIHFWCEIVSITCNLLNRTHSSKPNNNSPLELLISQTNLLFYLKVFGCTSYAHLQEHNMSKL